MQNRDLVAWLAGFWALGGPRAEWDERQRRVLRAHAQLVAETTGGALTVVTSSLLEQGDTLPAETVRKLVEAAHARQPPTGNAVCFFLQGFFELSTAPPDALDARQCRAIARECERNVDGLPALLLDFYWELRTHLAGPEKHGAKEKEGKDGSNVGSFDARELRQAINDLFEHVVDPSFGFSPERSAKLQRVHDAYHTDTVVSTSSLPGNGEAASGAPRIDASSPIVS